MTHRPPRQLTGYVEVEPVSGVTIFHERPVQIHDHEDPIAPAGGLPECDRGFKILTPPSIKLSGTNIGKGSGKKPGPAREKNRPSERK
jgi:hypothetical protein